MSKCIPAKDLLVLQARLFSPAYVGSARWLIFKASTRRTFAANGPDVVPDVIALLAGPVEEENRVAKDEQTPPLPSNQIKMLMGLGVMEANGGPEAQSEIPEPTRNVTSLFQMASFDYPFHDYADPAATADYKLLIESFLAMGAPPAKQIAFEGEAIRLPPVPMTEPTRKGINLEVLSYLLGHAFRPTGSIHTDSMDCIRRTSPSGGARHPTEPLIVVRAPLDGLPVGEYFYCSAAHALVKARSALDSSWSSMKVAAPLSLVLWLKVERAMWRYRDLRALRPVLMDVGHILETLSVLSANLGLSGIATRPPPVTFPLSEWLDGPTVMSVHFLPGQVAQGPLIQNTWTGNGNGNAYVDLLTSPAFVMAFRHGLEGRVLWPTAMTFGMDLIDFKVMNHCIPSRRGDRLTTCQDICEVIPGATPKRIHQLVEYGALLPNNIAAGFYQGMRPWVRYGWYLSCLAHLEAADAWQKEPPEPQPIGIDGGHLGDLSALYARRTTRRFSSDPISIEIVQELMTTAFDLAPSVRSSEMQVYVSPTRVSNLEPGLYRWQSGLHPLGMPSERFRTPAGISSLVIGQASAGAGALAVWMITQVPTDNGAKYQDAIIRMGRLGQRLCLATTKAGLGIFLTPAITDALVAEMLHLEAPQKAIGYFFSIGIPAGGARDAGTA